MAPLVVDLAAWTSASAPIPRPSVRRGLHPETEAVVPVAGKAEWSSLKTRTCGRRGGPLRRHRRGGGGPGPPVLDPTVGTERQDACSRFTSGPRQSMEAGAETLGDWVESLAGSLHRGRRQRGHGRASTTIWPSSSVRRGDGAAGSSIILDRDSTLQPAMGAEREDRRAPRCSSLPPPTTREPTHGREVPRALATASCTPTRTSRGPSRSRSPPPPRRTFLESNGLVREYRTDQLLAVLRDLLTPVRATGSGSPLWSTGTRLSRR